MNLALVVHDFDPAVGHGRYCLELARRLAPRHELTVYANRFAAGAPAGWREVRVPAWRRAALASVFTFLFSSERLVRRGRHDVVHAQGLTCWGADVITAHICNAARYRISPPQRLRSRLFPLLVNPVESRFYRQPRARHLIAISRRVGDEIEACYDWRRPVTVIHHGVDTTLFRPAENPAERLACRRRFRLPDDAWTWLFVGEAIKGLPETIAQLPAFPEARLLVVSRSDRTRYESQARDLGVAERLHFHGPEREIALAYRAADVFVYPSTYDTFGMVVSEAMATGLPTLVGRNIGAAEVIADGENGFLVDPTSAGSLRRPLELLRAHPDLARRIGTAARDRARVQTWDRCADATEAVYRRTVEPPGGQARAREAGSVR
jgi:glycosyltransferase involved in cell wall biosynthesis